MKKLIYLLLIFPLFISCSSDDSKETPNAYNGTKWEYTQDEDPNDDSYLTHTLIFKSNTECTLILKGYVSMVVYFEHQYTYEINDETQLLLIPEMSGNIIYKGVVNQNNMTLINTKTEKEYVTLSKI